MASMPYDQWSVEEVPAFCESVSQPSQVPGKTVLSGRIVRSTKEKPQTQKDSGASMVAMPQRRVLILVLAVLPVLVLIGVGIQHYYTSQTAATTPGKIAEGAYSVVSTTPSSHESKGEVDSFTLWSDPGQRLRAAIAFHLLDLAARDPAKPRHQTETLEMNSDFSMRRVRYELENTNISGDGALDCLVKLLSLDCVSTFEGASGSGHIEATGGYATQFGTEVALLDFPWFFTTLVAHGERNAKDSTPLSAVTIAFDGQTPDTLVTGRVLGAKADYLDTEIIQIMDHAIGAHKFHVNGGRSRDLPDLESTVWVSDGGLLLALDWIGERWELTRFLQRERLIPELPVEDDESVAVRNSGRFERQESVRVQRAVWVEIGGREESMYQALHDAELVEIEEDKAGISEGKRFLHVQITDAGKAVATHWQEGAFAWDFPIAREKIIDIRPSHRSEKYHSALYIVAYRWELNELGKRLKDNLPQQWLTSSELLSAHVALRYNKNEWKVDTVQRPTEEALRRH